MLAHHQVEAVERVLALLEMRGGALLADEVGLGKSFVAAEVLRRFDGAGEIIVPATLVAQWRATLEDFGVSARVLTHDALAGDPFVAQPIRRLVIVDEAHAFRNARTQRYAALARRTIAARVLLVTATPICNAVEDLESLLRIFARDDVLADAGVPSIDAAFEARDAASIDRIVSTLVIRRDRRVLPDALRFGDLDRRVIVHDVPHIPEIRALEFPLVGACAILRRFLHRRLESSEAALLESVRRQQQFYRRALSAIAAGRTLPKREYRRAFAGEEDRHAFQDVLFWELFAPPGDADPIAIRAEMERLEAIAAAARASPCAKRKTLVTLLREQREPALIFTGSAATARDLAGVLRCGWITSHTRARDAVIDAFRRGRIDILVATDLAAEGLNLQRAGIVVHYDIPWNPVKLDQRNGRAHRIGQQRDRVRAIYFIPRARETRIVETVSRKNRLRHHVLRSSPNRDAHPPVVPTLRPRLTNDAGYHALARRCTLPASLARRHKAGIEQLMREMANEQLDAQSIAALLELIASEV